MKKLLKKILGIISNMIPKRKIILFESHSDFCDSSKTLYDYCIKNNVNRIYKIIWIVDNKYKFKKINEKNVKFINRKSIIKYYYYMVSKFCFYTHNTLGIKGNKNQIRYFLTHAALPIKDSRGCFWEYSFNTYIECTSEMASKYRCKTFGGGNDRVKILGLPRNDELFKKNNVLEKLNINNYSKIIIWMPTFKHHKNGIENAYKHNLNKDISLLDRNILKNINEILKKYNAFIIIKFHPAQDMNFVDSIQFSNIMTMTNEELQNRDIILYQLLGCTDALITDFSSVYMDYLLVDRPIGFELCDKEEYEKGRGFLIENPLEFMPGNKIYNEDDFYEFVEDICNGKDNYKDERKELCDKVHLYKDGNSCERILKELKII